MKNKALFTVSAAALMGFATAATAQDQEMLPESAPVDPAAETMQPVEEAPVSDPMVDPYENNGMGGPEVDSSIDADTDATIEPDVTVDPELQTPAEVEPSVEPEL